MNKRESSVDVFGQLSRMSRRQILRRGLLLGGVLTVLAACSAPAPAAGPTSASSTAAGGAAPAASSNTVTLPASTQVSRGPLQLVLAQAAEPTTLDPQFEQSGTIGTFLNPMLEHLMEFDRNLAIKNVLAASAQQPTDGVTFRFKLQPNVKFWDGTPLDANAIKFTYDRALNADNRQKGLSDPVPTLQGVSQVNVIDAMTVDVVTAQPSTLAWPFFCQEFILAPGYYGSTSFQDSAIHPMGSGPWKFVRWTKGDQLQMAANADYWRGKPQIDTLIFRAVPDASARLALLERGDADIISDVSPDDLPTITSNSKLRSETVPTTNRVHIGVPAKQPKWQDRQARTALNYAINVDNIIKFVLGGLPKERLTTPVVTEGWINTSIKPYTFDQAKARDMLNAANFDWNQPVKLYTLSSGMKRVDVAQAIVGDLQKLGMKADVEVMEPAVFNSRLKAADFDDLYLAQLAAPSYGPVEVALPTGDLGLDSTHFIDATQNGPRYVELYKQARTTFDDQQSHMLVNQLQELLVQESVWILLYLEPFLFGVNKRTDWRPTSYSRTHFWLPGEQDTRITG
jgi:peptide/nickel transport system substrate-binding protein